MLFWIDEHPDAYLWLAVATLAPVIMFIIRRSGPGLATAGNASSDFKWGFAVLAVLLVGRWPGFFVTREFNADESQLIAGAITLRHDPVFWRSVDGATGGPLDFFALLPVGWITGGDSYFSARLTALLLITAALLLVHAILSREFGSSVARVSTFPAICFEAFTLHYDFLHYSTELVPIALLALAACLGLPLICQPQPGKKARGFVLGCVLGAVPFGKLQAAPIAAGFGLLLICHAFQRWRKREPEAGAHLLLLAAGAVVPLVSFAAQLVATHELQNAVIPYLRANVAYIGMGLPSLPAVLRELRERLAVPGELFSPFFIGSSALTAIGVLLRPRSMGCGRWFIGVGTIAVLSLAAVFAPLRPFPHYLQLLVVPLTLLVGGTLGCVRRTLQVRRPTAERWVLGGALIVPVLLLGCSRVGLPHPDIGRLRAYQAAKMEYVATVIRRFAERGEALGFWGWHSRYYVETGMRQATREAFSAAEILKNPYAEFYHRRYLEDLTRSAPPVFVDASGGVSGLGDLVAHETFFPAVGRFIANRYTLVETVTTVRIYVRNDRLAEKTASKSPPHPTVLAPDR